MSDIYDQLARAEREIESDVSIAPNLAANVGLVVAKHRRRRRIVGGVVAGVLALASTAGIASASSLLSRDNAMPAAETTVTPSSSESGTPTSVTPSASQSQSASPSPSLEESVIPNESVLADGSTPLSAYPSTSIPWSQVGPGWNLVSYSAYFGEVQGIALLAPDGTWYQTAQPQASGSSRVLAWDGNNAWMGASGSPGSTLSLTLVDLKTGASQGTASARSQDSNFLTGVAPGVAVTYVRTTGSAIVGLTGPSAGAAKSCETLGAMNFGTEAGNPGVLFLPGSGGSMICMVPNSDNKTVVTLVNTSSGVTTPLATLDGPNASYSVVGWVDSKSFIFAELEKAYSNKFKQVYRFAMSDTPGAQPSITPVTVADLQLGVGLPVSVEFDRVSSRFLVQTTDNTSGTRNSTIAISTLDGRRIATVKSGCYDPVTYTTGEFLVSWCSTLNSFSRWQLSDGSAQGSWGQEDWAVIGVAGYPDN